MYLPMPQEEQSSLVFEPGPDAFPSGHLSHVALPPLEYFPEGQFLQLARFRVESPMYFPLGQLSHDVGPAPLSISEYFPVSHLLHLLDLTAPLTLLYLPAAQLVQSFSLSCFAGSSKAESCTEHQLEDKHVIGDACGCC